MTMKSAVGATVTAGAVVKAFADKVNAQIQEGKAKLEQLEAQAKGKKAHAELTAIASLLTARHHIQKKVEDLQKAHESNVPQAKADIESAIASFKSSIEELSAKFKSQSA